MDLRVFESLRHRMPWPVATRVMKIAGLSNSQGWEKTLQKLKDVQDPGAEQVLKQHLIEHACCGQKFVKFYNIDENTKDRLRQAIASSEISDTIHKQRFPYILTQDELEKVSPDPALVMVRTTEDGVGAVYSSAIRITTREQIVIDDVFGDPEKIRNQYDEVIGFKYKIVQLFNVIWIPHNEPYIEIRTDYPDGMPQELAHEIQSQFRKIANKLIGENKFVVPVDLFPLVGAMYRDAEEGSVVEMSFTTATASVKNEKMRRQGTCLRQELYHVGGMEALKSDIEPFKISIQWMFDVDGVTYQPELTLHGTSRGPYAIKGAKVNIISGALIKNCIGNLDYDHVKDRMFAHLGHISSAKAA